MWIWGTGRSLRGNEQTLFPYHQHMFLSYYSRHPPGSASIWTFSDKHQYLCKFLRLAAFLAQGPLC
jgi:hypothetical protein